MIDRINENSAPIISDFIKEEFDALPITPEEIYRGSLSKIIPADRDFLNKTGSILLDAATYAGNLQIAETYRLFLSENPGLSRYFQVIITETKDDPKSTLALLSPSGNPYVRISPVDGVQFNITSLMPEEDLPIANLSFSSVEPLLDTFRFCTAVWSLAERRIKRKQKVEALKI